jgi:integrase
MATERMLMMEGSRILTPRQYYMFREKLDPNFSYRMIADVLLNSGLRIVEFWKVLENPHWYNPSLRVIDLPKIGACKNPICGTTDRTIRLTPSGCKALETLLGAEIEYRSPTAMRNAFVRAAIKAGLGKDGINPKMLRKCLASWLVAARKAYSIDIFDITSNLGHDQKTLQGNYAGMVFSKPDQAEMVEFLAEWL